MKQKIARYISMFILLQLSSCIREEILLPPSIISVSSSTVTSGDVITLSGENFDPSTFQAFIDGEQVVVAGTVTLNAASIVLPTVTEQKEVSLHVTTRYGRSDESLTLTILPPVPLIGKVIPEEGAAGIKIKIGGKFFHDVTSVKFQSPDQNNSIAADFVVFKEDTLIVTVPQGLSQDAAGINVVSKSGTSAPASFTVIYPPTITSFSPESYSVGGLITLAGSNLKHTQKVTFGKTTAELVSISYDKVQVRVPAASVSDTIYLSNVAGTAKTSKKFVVAEGPEITGLDKESGSVGTIVKISGKNLQQAFEVRFGMAKSTISSNTATELQTVVPAGASTDKITLTTTYGISTSPNVFTVVGAPLIASFTPTAVAVGQKVTLKGLHFGATSATIKIGNIAVTAIDSWTDNQIVFNVPAGAATAKLSITTATGSFQTTDVLTITGSPQISSFTPTSGVPGTTVTINGTNFSPNPKVLFNNNVEATSITKATSTQIICTVPLGTITGKIKVDNAQSSGDFTINLKPVITSITPMRGGVNTSVEINGSYLTNSVVKFANNLTATKTGSPTDSKITVTVPAGAVKGKISVTNTGGTTTSTNEFEVLSAPTITSFSPSSGTPGTQVIITGTNLQYSPVVTFTTNADAVVKSVSSTQLVVEVPATASNGKISVKTEAVTSPVASAASFNVIKKPAITSLSPTSGTLSEKVIITGTDFNNVTSVSFDGVSTNNFLVAPTATKIEVRVPESVAATIQRAINVNVTTTAGTSANSTFQILTTPKFDYFPLSPEENPRTWALLIRGSSLINVKRVWINGGDAPIDYVSNYYLTTRVPSNAATGTGEIRLYYNDIKYISSTYTVLSTPPPGVFPPPFIIIPPPPPPAPVPANIDAEWPHPYATDYTIDLRTDDKDANGVYFATGSIRVTGKYYGSDPELLYLLDGKTGYGGWDRQSIWFTLGDETYYGAFSQAFQIIFTGNSGRQLVLGTPCANFPNCK